MKRRGKAGAGNATERSYLIPALKSIVHRSWVALYSSKARGKGSEMAALGRHPIDFQTTTLLSWEIKECKRFKNQCRPGSLSLLSNWSLSKILKWDLEPRSRWDPQVFWAETKCQRLLTFLLLQLPTMCWLVEGPISRTLQPNALCQFFGSISPQCSVPPSLHWGTRIHILERNWRILWTTFLKALVSLNIWSPFYSLLWALPEPQIPLPCPTPLILFF